MDPARIAELLQPFLHEANHQSPVADEALCRYISTYIDILLRWNARVNLTAIRNPEEIVTRHFGESLFAARHLFPDPVRALAAHAAITPAAERRQNATHGVSRGSAPQPAPAPEGRRKAIASAAAPIDQAGFKAHAQRLTTGDCAVADVGSGAGFPGIPMKLWNGHIKLTLIEANHKKATFLREVARALTLTNIDIFHGRAEDLADAQARFDIVTLRAVERFEDALPVAAHLLAPAGRLALLIGSSQQVAAAKALPTFAWSESQLIPKSRSRILLLGTSPAA